MRGSLNFSESVCLLFVMSYLHDYLFGDFCWGYERYKIGVGGVVGSFLSFCFRRCCWCQQNGLGCLAVDILGWMLYFVGYELAYENLERDWVCVVGVWCRGFGEWGVESVFWDDFVFSDYC